ncbi:MAG: C25 family cysteine peptidase, partial [Candidatus Kapaibacterium sp.]
MKLYAIAFILAVFCVANLHARQIEISSDNHGFTINFEIKKVYFNQSDTSAHIEINGHYAGSVAISQELDISALKLIFAAPPGGVDMQSEFFDLESLVIPDGAKAAIAESGHDRPSAEYTYKGRQRGVESYELTIYPYSLSKGHFGWMRRGSVRVEFSLPDNLSAGELPAGEQAFFGHFINPGHIPALLEKYSLSKKRPDRPMNKTGWYDPETEYVRVTTTRDGVAKIDVAEILGIKPGWNGMPSDRLNMLFLGADYPVYINDSDGTLGIGDEIYFYGRRAFGDTTWNANYTREAVFYLFMGESAGLRAELLPDPGPGAGKIESVRELMHIEQDNIYNKGKYFTLTETLTAEGWYWDELSSISNESLTHLQYLVPAGGENDEYHIGMTYQSMNDTLFPQDQPIVLPQNHLRMFINGVMKAEEEFICIQRGTIGATLPSSQMRSGLNKIVIESMPAEPGRNSVQSVDYFEIEGNFRPFAYKNEASFSISPVAADAAVEVHGFSHASVVAYDLANHRIAFPKVAEGLSYTLNSVAGDSSAMTIRLDDSLYYSQKKGLHIAIKRSSGNSEYRLFEDISNENEILSFVQSATTGDYLAFALNSDKRITGKTAERIAGLGSGAIYSVRGGAAWSYIARKTGDQTYEYINESHNAANANIAGFMHMEGGASVSASIAVPAGSEMRLVINDGKSIEQASISNVETSDLASGNNPAEAIIVSHPDFMTYAEMLANHRSSQGITTVAINVENIYKEFGYGWKSPHAIKDFLAMAYNEWSDPRPAYLILFGDASWDPRKNGEYSIATDFVPTYGNPTSDYWYGFIDESDGEYNSELIIGRIPVTNDFEAAGYIAKVLEYDSIPARPWMKNFLLMTGGTASDHSDEYYYTLNWNYYEFILNPELCADTTEIRKSDQLATGEANAIEIIDAINSGAIWVNFLGHGSPWVIEMGGWQPEKLNNKGRYPILTTQSCNTGAYGEPSIIHSINEGYVVIPEKGMIAAMGMTFTGSVGAEVELFVKMFRSMVRPNMRYRRVGDAMNYAKSLLGVSGAYLNYRYQYSLLGDPLTTIRIEKQPELFLHEPDISITDQSGETVFNDSDEKLIINAVVH